MEEDETRIATLRAALKEGEESGYIEDFDPSDFLNELNVAYEKEIQTV